MQDQRGEQRQKHDDPVEKSELAVNHQQVDASRDSQQDRVFTAQYVRLEQQRGDQRGNSKNQTDVGNVGAHGVANRQRRIAAERSHGRYEDLGRRGPEPHDCQADQ